MTGAQILIVEDEALIAEDIRQRLMQLNYEIIGVADSGVDAVQLAKALRPDLVLMDGGLKGNMDGFESAHLIEQLLGCPIVYVTSNARAREMPYSVQKPFTTPALGMAIAQALQTWKKDGYPV